MEEIECALMVAFQTLECEYIIKKRFARQWEPGQLWKANFME